MTHSTGNVDGDIVCPTQAVQNIAATHEILVKNVALPHWST